jgi:peptidoglycan/xylan/chitin deacetylase (PgdA/CDA1 family)
MFWEQSSHQLRKRIIARIGDFKNRCAAWSAVPPHCIFGRHESAGVGVITYHRVMPQIHGKPPAPLSVTPQRFAAQLAGLLATGYEPISIGELVRGRLNGALLCGRTPKKPTFAVAFDDAFECVHRFAFPILRDLGIPATVFTPTAYLDSQDPLPFDPWSHAGERSVPCWSWRAMSREHILELRDSGLVEIGSHTHTHSRFEDVESFRRDLDESAKMLSTEFGIENPHFSFPFGANERAMQRAVRDAGMSCAFTTNCGNVHRDDNPYRWSRLGAEQWDSPLTLAAKIDGWFEHLRNQWRLKRPFRRSGVAFSRTQSATGLR